ncbi:hypothetical protein [uncultured Nocardioides sp.]|jgi:hypothetical protein|uniref:hypothetical protein n=1 Tax=uncultured Nocardioides sp. TaxID=198441 RepID=UPI002608C58C|nr:hypothetical protein [uncultured Nocardioides sp.]HRD59397.1 hypothetical protein [Nocardioides sp.]
MTVRHYAFANLGRDKSETKSTQPIDRRALAAIHEAVGDKQAAVVFCEINEGDDNDELALLRAEFKGWRLYGRTTREPVLLSPDQPRAKAHVQWVPDTAVPHWSPRRSWLTVNLADCDDTILSGHPAAGAHGKGSRPKRWQPAINTSFDNMRAAKENKVHRLHGKGRNLVILTDENDFDIPDIHPRVKTVFHKWSDYGQVIPTRGYGAEFRAGEVVPIGLDSHSGRLMHGRFVKR